LLTNIITTFAGSGDGYNGDNILAVNAFLYRPFSIRCDTIGNIYFNDQFNFRIRKITISTNIITTITGIGLQGYNGDNIAATNAKLYW
jgi:hypothetical protein